MNTNLLNRVLLIPILYIISSFSVLSTPNECNEELLAIPLNPEVPYFCLQEYARFLPVRDGHLSPQQALDRKSDFVNWEDFDVQHDENEIWVYFSVMNASSQPHNFYLNGQLTDYISLYQIKGQKPQFITQSGYLIPFKERPIKDWGTVISDVVHGKSGKTYLFRLKSVTRNSRYLMDYALLDCVELYSHQGYTRNYRQHKDLMYFFLGAVLIMFIYNFIISVFTMYKDYFLFSIYSVIIFATQFFLNGFHVESGILPVHDLFRNVEYIFFSIKFLAYCRFSVQHLDLKSHFPRIYALLNWVSWIYPVAPICILFSWYSSAFFLTVGMGAFFYILIFYTSAHLSVNIKSARFMLLGVILIMTIGILYVINLLNWITSYQLVVSIVILHITEIVVFSFAVAFKLRASKREMYNAKHQNELQRERLRLEEEMRKRLEAENDQKSRSLTTTSIQMLNFNERLSKIISNVNQGEDSGKKLIKELEDLRRFEDQWKVIKSHFESVHPDFFEQIESSFPNISPNEQRLLAFLKMKLSIKEIAVILNVTRGAVEQAKRRLNRKLGIDSADGSNDILKYIEEYQKVI